MARKRVEWIARRCGVPVEQILQWAARQGMPYSSPKDQMSDTATASALQAFGGGRQKVTRERRGEAPAPAPARKRKKAGAVPGWYPRTEIVNDLDDWASAAMASVDKADPLAGRRSAERGAPVVPRRAEPPRRVVSEGPSAPARRTGKTARSKAKEATRKESGFARLLKQRKLEGADLSELLDALPGSAQELIARGPRGADLKKLAQAVDQHIAPLCSDPGCAVWHGRFLSERKAIAIEDESGCAVCSGSATTRAAHRLGLALLDARQTRVLIVGGNQEHARLLEREVPGLHVRYAAGGSRCTSGEARGRIQGAALVLVAGSKQISSAVRSTYRDVARKLHVPLLQLPRTGLEAMVVEVERHNAG